MVVFILNHHHELYLQNTTAPFYALVYKTSVEHLLKLRRCVAFNSPKIVNKARVRPNNDIVAAQSVAE